VPGYEVTSPLPTGYAKGNGASSENCGHAGRRPAGTLRSVKKRVRILLEGDVRAALDMASCIDACRDAFVAYSAGGAELPGVIHLEVPEARGEIHVKAGHLHGAPFYAVKAASGFAAQDPPAIDGLVVVFDARNGAPAALLLDNGFVTDQRTGAAGGVAAAELAPAAVGRVAVIGTGIQARRQVEALRAVRPGFGHVRVWGRDKQKAAACAADLAAPGCEAVAVTTAREAVNGAHVVLTCTASREPLVELGWLAAGAHVTAVGSDGEGKQELDPEILRAAHVLAVDSREQCARLGELQHAPDQRARAAELGEVIVGSSPGRTAEDQLTVCDLTGVGVQDVAAANVVLARAGDTGETIEL
jgi:ornithine cyclodeaminase/alanine dehydrogenase-like protein (mu-crystallin family)